MYANRPEKIVATIEARMTSSRLPGKVLLPIGGVPALEFMSRRLKRSSYLDAICVATTTNAQDDVLFALAERLGVAYFRGSEEDVLGRVLAAARAAKADVIVELTGDCPFADPELVDRGIEELFSHDVDYASNTLTPTYPNGFDVQMFPLAILAEVAGLTNDPVDRAHASYYIYMHPEKYRCYNWKSDAASFGPELRVTLDEDADYRALHDIARSMPDPLTATAGDIVGYLRAHPEVVALNAHVRQKEAHEL